MNSFLQNSFIINLFVRRMKSLGKYIFLIFLFIASCSGIPFAQENKQGICKVSNLENGNYVPNKTIFKIGEWLQYQCDDGYMTAQRNIVEEAECLLSGWSAVLQCSEIKCSVPPSTGFDKLHPVYSNGQVGKFSCDEGMILRGSAISQCYYYGWDPPLPVCEGTLKCNKPPSIPFGTLDSATTKDVYYSGDVVIYKCSKDFEMNGEAESFCINGKWSLPPSCGKQGQNCLSPPFVANGEVKGIIQKLYTSGSILEYQCQKYYKAFGSLEITCRNGHWTETPVCLEPCTVGQRELFNNNIELKNLITEKHYFEHGQIIEFLCLPGYQLETSPSTLTTKCERGKLIYPKCAKKGSDGCAISKEIMLKNGVNLNNAPLNIAEGYTVEFQCVGNLVPEKTLSAKCNKGEIVYPQCIEQGSDSCQLSEEKIIQNNILLPRSASHRKVFKSGEMMLVRCKPGFFSISPPLQLKCLDRKLTYPKCTHEQPCRISQEKMDENFLELTTIEDNKVYFEDGANIHFACKPGFSSESDLIGLCFKQDILYPLCHKTVIVSSVAAT
ncbi:complement factor H-related protein 1-like isoform X3 [Rana temporaria]|uniref:complement factor H-related protein 1-like isoform X3 n=1 Tax=Rana temporaria TaxID=8407 RepID=UPI001AADCD29|nr:complement factor H-related protein 1-like isoform X3 [Rana temporaria]